MGRVIVVGVDGSETALRAAHKAAELAQALGAELHILSAYGKFEVEVFSSGQEQIEFSSAKDAASTARDIEASLRKEFPGLSVGSASAEGKPGPALANAAQRLGADLIVVGNRRVQGLTRMLGSVARDVAAHAPCDLYVVHTTGR